MAIPLSGPAVTVCDFVYSSLKIVNFLDVSSDEGFALIQFLCSKKKKFPLQKFLGNMLKFMENVLRLQCVQRRCAKLGEGREAAGLAQSRRQTSTSDRLMLKAAVSTMMCLSLLEVERGCLE